MMSAYEQQRLKNIEKNHEQLVQLGLEHSLPGGRTQLEAQAAAPAAAVSAVSPHRGAARGVEGRSQPASKSAG